ncbi:MAG: nicotinate-nucleotide--dimethylbenzimidazole phosphoribosyltransferase [Anaerolineaceae bacterium]|nr:nicotinate-nucleotide--dimethylbenzimidazole phosphoribosyltransferase [Anaerolineaceae bacterium]
MNLPTIPNINEEIRIQAAERQIQLTKPTGSMGRLEELSIDIAGMTGVIAPELKKRSVFLMAADHGIAREGVSPYPTEVTPQMVMNFLNHGAAINVLTKQSRSDVVIVDIGVNYDFPDLPGLIRRKVAKGTANMLHKEAMTIDQAEEAIQIGMDVLNQAADNGLQMAATGEMGIGNTTSAAAITAVLCGKQPAEVTGRGTGLDDVGLARKVAIIEQVLKNRKPDVNDPMDILCKIGGLEIAGMAGVTIAAASRRIPLVMDGLISTAAAALADTLVPGVRNYLIAGHRSPEIGHKYLLEKLGKYPLLQLDMRVGEGTGAALAFQLVDAANNILRDMATFESAGVSNC